ncbi:hypothetical protein Mia14_0291 [Candidatus Mancarchaeum acidiphilum]|uniref:Uncharacterized protein n=1 Tax=Candidatus Mancarchaeum acidiphilum TaxID=1920749 RepID=A0A218NME0_9ARCH|nr:hypothetical protein [Candidatus Mancarchaeum acidiphilum]ASI13621.1 hypothetical protein Mia14_0291 [Candidatus Mancarchaeum acidiphilum]
MGILGDLKSKIEGPAITATPDEVFDFLTNDGYQSMQMNNASSGAAGRLVGMLADSIRDIKLESSDGNSKTITYSYKAGPEVFSNKLVIKILSANDHQASWMKFEAAGGYNPNTYQSPSQKFESQIRNMVGQRFGTTQMLHTDKDNNRLI